MWHFYNALDSIPLTHLKTAYIVITHSHTFFSSESSFVQIQFTLHSLTYFVVSNAFPIFNKINISHQSKRLSDIVCIHICRFSQKSDHIYPNFD